MRKTEKSNTFETEPFCTFPTRSGGFCGRPVTDERRCHDWRCQVHQDLFVVGIEDNGSSDRRRRLVKVDDANWGLCDIDLHSREVFKDGVYCGRLCCYDNVWFVD